MRDSGFPVGTRIYVCLHAEHHGLPVTFEITPGPVRPQTAQVRAGRGTHLPQSGPSGVRTCTGRRRPHSTQVSWLVGSVIRQCAHSGRPCSSRVAASRTAPHRPQGWARDFAVQSRHSHFPSIRLCRWTIRPQRGQGGGRSCSLRSRTGYRSAAARSCRGVGAGAGEQLGPVLQRPSKPKAVPGPRGRLPYGCGGDVRRQGRVGGGYHVDRALERVTPIVGRTRHAAWFSVAVARVDRADSAALAAGFADRTADSAIPVVAGTCAGSPLWVRPRHGRVH